ncbi:MAG: hypothetical protein EU533_06285 [Promethearchaeota archaeon]|nr:MAG: hypothetical protein EU533_06285 [Candidatus Lokiarchaeota archaeon]
MQAFTYSCNLSEAFHNLELCGAKSANLGKLIYFGFPVPEGFVINTSAFKLFLEHNKLQNWVNTLVSKIDFNDSNSINSIAEEIRQRILESELPQEIVEEIKIRYSMIESPVAIRSSATLEDLSSASSAGQMETSLNITSFEAVIDKITECFASLYSPRALAYRHRIQFNEKDTLIAVIIQKMVPSKSAGVIFTANPVTGDKTELIIESNWGLGESVVSGYAEPDKFILKKSVEENQILSREIGSKNIIIDASETGIIHKKDDERKEKASLTDEEIIQLSKIAVKIETEFNEAQDIEWAIDYEGKPRILQSRPITFLKETNPMDNIVWSRGYSDDYWNDAVSPLFFELLGDHLTEIVNVELNKIMGYNTLNTSETSRLLRLHKAHAYFNLEVLMQKVSNEIPGFLRNEDLLNYFPTGRGKYGKDTIKNLPFNLFGRLWAELRVAIKDPNGKASKTATAYNEWTHNILNPYFEEFMENLNKLSEYSNQELFNKSYEANEIMISHYRLVRYGIPVHNIGMNLLTQYLLNRWIGREEASRIYPILVSGLEHKTSETNSRINELADIVRSSQELTKLIHETPSNEIIGRLEQTKTTDSVRLQSGLKKFNIDFGFRGFTREAYYKRWGEDPSLIFNILKPLAIGNVINFSEIEKQNIDLKNETEKYVKEKINSSLTGPIKWKFFSGILNTARKYIIFREQQRYNLDKWITMMRYIYLEAGKRFVQQGILKDPSEIFFLNKKEVKTLLLENKEPINFKPIILERESSFHRYENITPPKFLQGEREFNDPPPLDSKILKGMPASQGLHTAPIRVLLIIDDIWKVKAGEILIVPRTDPGWTPIFSKIGGLVTETGGILSHGAVVAREYGIPAVTNVYNACKILKTGMNGTIDGVKGEVTIIE